MRHVKWLLAIVLVAVMLAAPAAMALTAKDIETEKKLGQDAAKSTDPTLKFITDEKYTKRVERIGKEIAAIAKTVKVTATYGNPDLADFEYVYKVVDDKDVNALSLPGGYVYVNKGLLDRVESDDELAGVIAHEVAHIAHHHMLQLLKKQSKYDTIAFAMLAAAILGKADGADVQNVFYGAKLFEIAKLNAYSREAENDADNTAIEYMIRAKYNPVGMLTFMEKLAREHAYNPIEPGVFQSHPDSRDRVSNIINQLKKRNIPINRRAVSSGIVAVVHDTEVKDKKISEVMVDNKSIFRPADIIGSTSEERAKSIADALNKEFDNSPEVRDVKIGGEGYEVFIKDRLIVLVKQEDADLAGMTREALAIKVKEAIQTVIMSENLKLMY